MPHSPRHDGSDAVDVPRLADLLGALGHTTRLRIVIEFGRAGAQGMAVGSLQERLGIGPASTLLKHLAHLVTAGLITQERRSTVLVCRVSSEALADVRRDLGDVLGI